MSIQYHEQVLLFTYDVCFGYLNVFFQPSAHFHDKFLLGEKNLSFYLLEREYAEKLKMFFQYLLKIFLMKLFNTELPEL